ncbi:phosphatidate cytidylyltransferase, partial [Bacillus safensis]
MKQRILTGVLAAAVFLLAVIYGQMPFTLLIYLMGSVALFELLRMKKISIFSFPGIVSLILLWLLMGGDNSFFPNVDASKMQIALFAVLILLTYTVLSKNSFTFDEVAFVVLATLYIGVSFYYFIQIRGLYGMSAIFFAAVIIWSTDSGAYFIGKSMGKRKLWPEISPNKTVEG